MEMYFILSERYSFFYDIYLMYFITLCKVSKIWNLLLNQFGQTWAPLSVSRVEVGGIQDLDRTSILFIKSKCGVVGKIKEIKIFPKAVIFIENNLF